MRLPKLINFYQCLLIAAVLGFTALLGAATTYAQSAYPVKVAGDRHTLILYSDGTIIGYGPCDWGELGPIAAVPQRRNWATTFVSIKLPRKAVDIAAAESASFALLDDGTLYAWGSNYKGALGAGSAGANLQTSNGKNGSDTPIKINGLSNVVQIAADGSGVLALLKNGSVYAWGEKFKGKFGDGQTPTLIPGLNNIAKISVGYRHFLVLDASNHVWVWGENYCGQTSRTNDPKAVVQVPELTDVVSIAAGACVSTAVKKDGTVWVWGSNGMAGFGNGQQTEGGILQFVPQQVSGVRNAVAVSSGEAGRHTLVLLKDGTLRGWGNTDWGQVGAGVSGMFQPTPAIPKITNVKAVFAVANNSFAVKNDNSFWIWGVGYRGEYPLSANVKIPMQFTLK